MPFAAVELRPGVNTQRTPSLNEAGVSVAQAIRYKDTLIQALGGWTQYVPFTVPSTVRDLHAWQDAAAVKHLGVAATANLQIITSGSNSDITPQTSTTNFSPNFTSSLGSATISISDGNSSGLGSIYNTVFFNTPIAISGLLLSGAYRIQTVTSSIAYTITAAANATSNVVSSGILPTFTVSSGSGSVTVTLPNNNYIAATGVFYPFYAATTVGTLSISGPYQVQSIIDSTSFKINATALSCTAASSTQMNSGNAQLIYYVTYGPQPSGSGFGAGGFGSGGFGTGSASPSATAGTPITTTDWTQDNFGEVLLACPKDGPIYAWSPEGGLTSAQVVPQAPFFNGGIFVAMPQQMVVAWRSCQFTGAQDNLIVRWSHQGDYTNWTVSNQTTAGSFRIPTGSIIRGGMQGPTQAVIWTDVDCWVMQYVGGLVIFNFSRVGSGCGLIGSHAMGQLNGIVFWMGVNNFFMLSSEGVVVIPCTVWDFVFQNLSTAYQDKVRCAINSAFNEITWHFPSSASTGENDSYVKFNIVEKEWDSGTMRRTAWVDVSVLGNPIGSDTTGTLYQHEMGNVTLGVSNPSFQSGWWTIMEGEELGVVDFVIPDFRYGTYSGSNNAQIQMTFYAVDYPNDTPRVYGPYTITQNTEYITPRIRGRLMSVLVQGDGQGFWRLGRIRYRVAKSGRR